MRLIKDSFVNKVKKMCLNMQQKEVAKNLGVSQPRVNRLKKRALKRLKNFNCINGVIKNPESL